MNMALIEFTGNKQVLIGRITMTRAGYSGGQPSKREGRGVHLATTGLFFPAGGGLWEAEKQ